MFTNIKCVLYEAETYYIILTKCFPGVFKYIYFLYLDYLKRP